MRDSVRLNSFESFLVTLPSISSETWEMYSWAISGSSVFRDWLFLVFSGVSLETAAIFLLFLKVAMLLREKFYQQYRLNWSFIFVIKVLISSYYEGKGSIKTKELMTSNPVQYSKATNYILILVLSFLLFIPFRAGNINVYTPTRGTNREKYFNHIIYKGILPTLAGNKHLFVHFFLHGPRLFHPSTEKIRVQSVRNGHQSGYSQADTLKNNINKRWKKLSIKGIKKMHWKNNWNTWNKVIINAWKVLA